jgi:hypothetical protein
VKILSADAPEGLNMSSAHYFVGKYGDVGHEEKAAGKADGDGRAYPVFSTYNRSNPDERHVNAWFIHESDAIAWADMKNGAFDGQS